MQAILIECCASHQLSGGAVPVTNKRADITADQIAPIVAAFAGNASVTQGKMFGSTALKVNGKVFAMVVKGKFVAKLPTTRIAALMREAGAENFDPGHGKLMKEWVALHSHRDLWTGLANEAYKFVLGRKS
jgi:TfoX/Sxy family transcriptional regulator of competence genes